MFISGWVGGKVKNSLFLGVSPTMDAARIPREATRGVSAVYSIFGLDLPSFVRRARSKTCMLTINRLKVNNSTQLNFTSPTVKGIAYLRHQTVPEHGFG